MADASEVVRRLWALCSILRDEGITYHEYLAELTYLLFLKLADELGIEGEIPPEYRWNALAQATSKDILSRYKALLKKLGESDNPTLRAIFATAQTRLRSDNAVSMLVRGFAEIDWYRARQSGLGDIY